MDIHPKLVLSLIVVAFVGTNAANAEGDLARIYRKNAPGIIKKAAEVGCTAVGGPSAGADCRKGAAWGVALPPPGRPYYSQQNQQAAPQYEEQYAEQYQPQYQQPYQQQYQQPYQQQYQQPYQQQYQQPYQQQYQQQPQFVGDDYRGSYAAVPAPMPMGSRCQTFAGGWDWVSPAPVGTMCSVYNNGRMWQGHRVQ
jgi:hypothetical protein